MTSEDEVIYKMAFKHSRNLDAERRLRLAERYLENVEGEDRGGRNRSTARSSSESEWRAGR